MARTAASLYARFCERFSEERLITGTWEAEDDQALKTFHDKGLVLYPTEVRPPPRSRAPLGQHPLFSLAYVALRGDDIETSSWPMVVEWFRAGDPLNDREIAYLAHALFDRLDADQSWYGEATPAERPGRVATAERAFQVVQDLGWDPYARQDREVRKRWKNFLTEHPMGHVWHQRQEERVLRAAMERQALPAKTSDRRRL